MKKRTECNDPVLGRIVNQVRISWDYPEQKILSLDNVLHFHPVTWCRMIAKSGGYNFALDQLRHYLHERIDRQFNAHK